MDTERAGPAGRSWRVGDLARATGLTVRALHYYDEIGLLTPSGRTPAGHRSYDSADVARLYRISLLRRLGFPLGQIASVLDDPAWQLGPAVDRHLRQTQNKAAIASRLCARLSAMAAELAQQAHPSPADLFTILEDMTMLDDSVRNTISILVYEDLPAAHEYLVRVYGLSPGPLTRDDSGRVIHGEVRAGEHVIWLHPAGSEFRSPRDLGGASGMTVVTVDDADAHHARSVGAGAEIIEEPVDQPYAVREYGARDLEGQLWFFHSPIG
jgi:MerR family transcriptional regulator, thiopeptide resistance regulator